jgi:rod shape determining protein RodA
LWWRCSRRASGWAIAYPAYLGALILLVGVELVGVTAGGAQRWIDIGPIRMQPSEVMKIALVLALARYYHDLPEDKVSSLGGLIIPAGMIAAPMGLIIMQPDLGTSLLLAATGAVIVFMAGLSWWVILGAAVFALAGALTYLNFFIEPYQLARITTFLNPSEDPMGAGYQILQSQIALGSGGATGKGYLQGTQGSLDFLPEKQTDFIFTMLGEEFGFVGGLVVSGALCPAPGQLRADRSLVPVHLFAPCGDGRRDDVCALCLHQCRHGDGPVAGGWCALPLISYGGTVMLAVLFGLGLILGPTCIAARTALKALACSAEAHRANFLTGITGSTTLPRQSVAGQLSRVQVKQRGGIAQLHEGRERQSHGMAAQARTEPGIRGSDS